MKRIIANHESEVPQMKRIGVIGGMGQWATMDVIERILKASVNYPIAQYGNRGYPPMDIRMVNKAPMILNSDGSYPEKLEPSEALLEAAEYVGEKSDFIIVTSNTAHIFQEQIEKTSNKPLLSLIDVAVEEAVKRNYKKVGIMAIGVTIRESLFQQPLGKNGIESVLLSEKISKALEDEGIYPVQEGAKISEELARPALIALNSLRDQGVDGIILGCTEIPILLGDVANDSDVINPSQLIAEKAIKEALFV